MDDEDALLFALGPRAAGGKQGSPSTHPRSIFNPEEGALESPEFMEMETVYLSETTI